MSTLRAFKAQPLPSNFVALVSEVPINNASIIPFMRFLYCGILTFNRF